MHFELEKSYAFACQRPWHLLISNPEVVTWIQGQVYSFPKLYLEWSTNHVWWHVDTYLDKFLLAY